MGNTASDKVGRENLLSGEPAQPSLLPHVTNDTMYQMYIDTPTKINYNKGISRAGVRSIKSSPRPLR